MLTEADDLSQFSVFDVVLPLPGYAVQYPQNSIADTYKDMLAVDEVSMDVKRPAFDLPGRYRRILSRAEDLTWYRTQ